MLWRLLTMTTTTAHPSHAAIHHDPQAAANAVAAYEESRLRELASVQKWRARAWVAARFVLGGLFIAGAVGKIVSFGATQAAMREFGLELTGVLLTTAIAVEGIAGFMLLAGYEVRRAAIALMLWLGTVTVVIHGNVTIDANRAQAFNNLAIMAALLFLYAHGAGNASIDQARERKAAREA